MEHLAYPAERRNIALDYDATASTNIAFWQNFVRLAHASGYDVYIVTARHPTRIEEPKLHFEGLVRGIIATSHQAKLAFCQSMGLRIDIFIDDSPWNIYCNIDGSTPSLTSRSVLEPDFGSDIANLIFPRNHSLKIRGYGFFYTDCHHEVPLIQQSFHRTKKGAYRAMRNFLEKKWATHREREVTENRKYSFNKNLPSDKRQGRWYNPFMHSLYKVLPTTVEIHE
jgi:hypothetical protein